MSEEFNRANLDHYLYLLAKEYKKMNRSNPEAEIVIVGGAALLINYNFRDSTSDIDGLIRASASIKDAITKVGDACGLSSGWINEDFRKTLSYSTKLVEVSKFYKRFCNCLSVRTIEGANLVAMKLRASRNYKHDLSDIIGIIKEHQELDRCLTIEEITSAYLNLYSEELEDEIVQQLNALLSEEDLEELFYKTVYEEQRNYEAIQQALEEYPDDVKQSNLESFIQHFRDKNEAKDVTAFDDLDR